MAFYTLLLPALFRLMGLAVNSMLPIKATLEEDVNKKPHVERLVHGLVRKGDSSYSVLPLVGPDVEVFSAMEKANGLIIVDQIS